VRQKEICSGLQPTMSGLCKSIKPHPRRLLFIDPQKIAILSARLMALIFISKMRPFSLILDPTRKA
jgi:hypothetical protein